jgi:hypothetical protein
VPPLVVRKFLQIRCQPPASITSSRLLVHDGFYISVLCYMGDLVVMNMFMLCIYDV